MHKIDIIGSKVFAILLLLGAIAFAVGCTIFVLQGIVWISIGLGVACALDCVGLILQLWQIESYTRLDMIDLQRKGYRED